MRIKKQKYFNMEQLFNKKMLKLQKLKNNYKEHINKRKKNK